MNSVGFDLVVEIHKQLYNKILEDIYKKNPIIAAKKGGLFSYELVLDQNPTVDYFNKNCIFFIIELNTKIHLLNIFNINMDSEARVGVLVQSDKPSKKLEAKVLESKLTMKPRKSGNIVVRQFSRIYYHLLNFILNSRLSHHYEKLALSPNLYSFTLPELEKESFSPIQLNIIDVNAVNRDIIAILTNLLGRTGGSANLLTDYTVGQDISFILSADAMKRAKKYWWENSNRPITDEIRGKLEIKPDLRFELLTRLSLVLEDLLERHALSINHEVREWWIDYSIEVKLSEPELMLKEGNELEISGLEIRLNINADLQFLASTPNMKEKSQTITIATFTERDLNLIVREATASIQLDNNYRIVAKLEKLDFILDLNWSIPSEALNLFLDRLEEHIIMLFPDIVISPAIIMEKIPGTDLQFKFDVSRIETSNDKIIVGGSLEPSVK